MVLKHYLITMLNEYETGGISCSAFVLDIQSDEYLVLPFSNLRTASAKSFNVTISEKVIKRAESLEQVLLDNKLYEFKISHTNFKAPAITVLDIAKKACYTVEFDEANKATLKQDIRLHREEVEVLMREQILPAYHAINLANYLTINQGEGLYTKIDWYSLHAELPLMFEHPAQWAMTLAMDAYGLADKGYHDVAIKYEDGQYLIINDETILAEVSITEGVTPYIQEVTVASIYGGYEKIVANSLDEDHALELINGTPLTNVPSLAVILLTSQMMPGSYKKALDKVVS